MRVLFGRVGVCRHGKTAAYRRNEFERLDRSLNQTHRPVATPEFRPLLVTAFRPFASSKMNELWSLLKLSPTKLLTVTVWVVETVPEASSKMTVSLELYLPAVGQ